MDLPRPPEFDRILETADELVAIMREWQSEVYKAGLGGYALSHSGGYATLDAVAEALNRGLISPKWASIPAIECWVLPQP